MKNLSYAALGVLLSCAALAEPVPTIIPPKSQTGDLPAVTDATVRAAIRKITPQKVILVGDSTTQTGSGWGGAFCAFHLTSFVSCINLARGGRGTFDYRAEGSWDIALSEMKIPGYRAVYVLIQFGHNDQPGKPGRSTDLYTEYPANLARYVSEARAAGAVPVLVTPLTRRGFKNGSLQDDLEPWAVAVRKVALDMNVPLVDLHKTSVAAVQAMGAQAALELAEIMPPQEVIDAAATGTTIPAKKVEMPQGATGSANLTTEVLEKPKGPRNIVFDYTHLGEKGARLFSAQVAEELARVVPALRQELFP